MLKTLTADQIDTVTAGDFSEQSDRTGLMGDDSVFNDH